MKKTIGLYVALLVLVLCPKWMLAVEGSRPPKTVLITGACGFIGSNFLTYMYDKYPEYNFIVLDALTYAGSLDNIPFYIQKSGRFQFVHDNIVNFPVVNELMARCDWVVHFAAETHVTRSIPDDMSFIETDLLGTRSLLRSLLQNREKVERFIHISTSEVYGTAVYQPMDERHPLQPRSPYAAAKAAADRLAFAYNCTFDIPVVIVRPFNNYGPRQHPEKMIPHFVYLASKGKALTIQGTGSQQRDWVFVLDLCRALDKMLHLKDFSKIKNQEINIGTGRATSVLEIARMILKKFNLSEDYLQVQEDRPGQVQCHICDFRKAQNLFGWEPIYDLESGLQETIDWYIKNPRFLEERENEAVVSVTVTGVKSGL